MPFTSIDQFKWAFATGQPWAEEWAKETDFNTLPKSANDRYKYGGSIQSIMFDEGGHVHPHINKPQINYARQDNTRVFGLGDDYAGETKATDYTKIPTAHDALDQASFLPVVGEAADVTNAALHLKEGNYEDAAYSTAGAFLPFVGGAALKAGAKGVKNWWKGLKGVPDLSKDLYKYPTKSFDPVKEPMFQRSVQGVDAHSVGSYQPYDNKISSTLDPSHKMHSKVGTDYVLPKGMDHAKLNEFAKRIVHGNNPENILSSVDPKLIDDVYNSLVKLNPSLKNIKNINKKDIIHGVASNINSKELFDVVDGINKPGEIKGWEEFVDKNWENPNIKNQGFDFVFSEKRQADILKLRDKGLLKDGGIVEKQIDPPITDKQWHLKADRSSERMRHLGDDTYEPQYSFPPFTVEADRKERDPFYRSGQISSMLTEGLIQPFSLPFTYPAHLTSQLKAKHEGKPTDFRSSASRPMVKDEAGVYQAPLNKTYQEYMDPNSPLWQKFGADMLADPWSYAPVAAAFKGGKTGFQMLKNAAKELPLIAETSGIYSLGKLGVQKAKQAGNWLGEHINPLSSRKYDRLREEAQQKGIDAYKRSDDLEILKDQKTELLLLKQKKQTDEIKALILKKEREYKERKELEYWKTEPRRRKKPYETGKSFNTKRDRSNTTRNNPYTRAVKDGNYTLDADGNIIRTDQSGTIYEDVGAVNVKDKEVIDFTTGKKVPIDIKTPGKEGKTKMGLTTDSKGKKILTSESMDTHSDVYVPNKELTQAYENNVTFIQNQLPGFKPMGSSQYHKFGVTHVTDDIDGIMKAEDWHPMSSNFNTTGQAKYGPTIELTNPALDNKVVGKVDVNLIYTDAKTGNASGGLATELYRQFFPDEFYAANIDQIKGKFKAGNKEYYEIGDWSKPAPEGVKFKINKTADELLEAYDPEIKSILDAMETSGMHSMAKHKHINRGDYIMEFGDPAKVLKAQYLYAKSIMGSSADLGKQFDLKIFDDYDNNIELLREIGIKGEAPPPVTPPAPRQRRPGGPPLMKQPTKPQPNPKIQYIAENIAKDPKRMQIALNDYYLNNSIYTRKVKQGSYRMSSYDDLLASFSEWEDIGGKASGIGLNAVKLGDPGPYGDVIGNRQFKLYDDAVETPQEYVKGIRNQTSGDRLIKEGEKQILLDIANRNNFTPKEGQFDKLENFEDLLDLSMGSNTVKNTRNFLSDIGKELGMKAISRPDIQHGNTTYATLLGNFDNELDRLMISLNENTPSLKSASERKNNLKYTGKQRRREDGNLVKDEQSFQKLKGYLDGGREISIERYKRSKKMYEALQEQKQILDAKIKERKFINIKKTHKDTPDIEKIGKERKELYKLISLAEDEVDNYGKIVKDLTKRKNKLIKTQKDLLLGAGAVGGGVLGSELWDAAEESQIKREERWRNNLKKYEERDKKGQLTESEKKHFHILKKTFSSRYSESEYRYGGNVKYENGDDVKKYDPRKFRAGIANPEARGNIDYSLRPTGAGNSLGKLTGMYGSTAIGPYQFVYGSKPGVGMRKVLKGLGWEGDFYNKDKSKSFIGNREWQEKLMDYYLEPGKPERYPWMAKELIKQYGPKGTSLNTKEGRIVQEGKDWSETGVIPKEWDQKDLMALEHFAGHGNMRQLFADVRAGKITPAQIEKYVPGGKNMTIGTYLKKFKKSYADSPKHLTEEESRELVKSMSDYPLPQNTVEPMSSTRIESPRVPEEIKNLDIDTEQQVEEIEDYKDGSFVKRALRKYPYLKGIYGEKGENIKVKKDRKFKPFDHGRYGSIEYFSPTQTDVKYSEEYKYDHPSIGKHGVVYNPRNVKKGDIFLDMLHGIKDDKEINPLLKEFSNAIQFQQGPAMDHWYDKDVAENDYKDSRKQWNSNYIDGILRSEISESMEWPTSDEEGYAATRTGNNPKIKEIAARIKKTLQSPKKEQPISKMEQGGEAIIEEEEIVETPDSIQEESVEVETPTQPIKEKRSLTKLTPTEAKRFNLWRIGWGLDDNQLKNEEEIYNIPGYFISDKWKKMGNSYTDIEWQR